MNRLYLELLLSSAYHAHYNSIVLSKYFERSLYPRLGDYVFESSTFASCFLPEDHKNHRDVKYNIGKLICIEWESRFLEYGETIDINDTLIEINFKHPSASTIETFNGDTYRWTNHKMILIPNHWDLKKL
jgi:hypothetical protein